MHDRRVPEIPDYTLLHKIGSGSYGEVWRATSATGAMRAVKVVSRDRFETERPYQREFEGIRRFERLSREHPSQLALFHVGRNETGQYFYYVMELADNAALDPNDPNGFIPRTLRLELNRGHLSSAKVIELGLALTEAVTHLHENGLVHRDIKPSNIVFINRRPKLADIGLVTTAGDSMSLVGTEGYIPPEGPGGALADLFSLGKVLYEALTGLDRRDFPKLPPDLRSWPDADLVFELNEIVLRACAAAPSQRYQSASEMFSELSELQAGRSLRSKRRAQAIRGGVLKFGLVASGGAFVIAIFTLIISRATHEASIPRGSTNALAASDFDLGRSHYEKSGDYKAAARFFRAAVAADPNFSGAIGALAKCLCWGEMDPFHLSFPSLSEVPELASRALRLDPSNADAHLATAWHAYIREWDWNQAEKEFTTAIRLAPRRSEPREWYALFLRSIGRISDAIDQLDTAERVAGDEPSLYRFFGDILTSARQYDEALRKFEKGAQMPNGWSTASRARYWREPAPENLRSWMRDVSQGFPEVTALLDALLTGARTEADFRQAYLPFLRARTKDPMVLAQAAALTRQRSLTLDYLEQAFAEHHDFLFWHLVTDPLWDLVRDEPRFQELLTRGRIPRERSAFSR